MTADKFNKWLADFKEIAAKRTPGKWEAQIPAFTGQYPTARIKPLKIEGKLYGHAMIKVNNAEYIAACSEKADKMAEMLEVLIRSHQALFQIFLEAGHYDFAESLQSTLNHIYAMLEDKK